MELALSGSLLRSFFKSVGCLSKIGPEVLVEATAGTGLTLKAMNTARSAFCSVTFKQASFEVFNVRTGTVQTAVLAKHLAAALRTQRLERVVISQKPGDAVTMSVRLECPHAGLVKNYGLNCVTDAEHLKATVDPSLMPITLVVRPKEFGRLLSHFQSAQTDVTVSFAPESTGAAPPVGGFTGGFGDGRGETSTAPARNLRLSSFSDPNAPPGQTLQTSISLDTAEDAVLRYEHAGSPDDGAGDAARDVTVNLKDLRAMVSFCESVDLDVAVYADCAGAPMLVRPTAEFKGAQFHHQQYGGQPQYGGRDRSNYFDAAAVDFDAELVLASMLPRDEAAEEPTETLGGTRRGDAREEDSVAPQGAFEGEGRRSEVTERGGGKAPSVSAAIPDSEAGGSSQPRRGGEASVGTAAGLKWAPGAAVNAAEEDDWDLGDAGGEFVDLTPPEKRRRV